MGKEDFRANILYGVLGALGLFLVAPYFGLGSIFGGENSSHSVPASPLPKRSAATTKDDKVFKVRRGVDVAETPKEEDSTGDAGLSDIEALLGEQSNSPSDALEE